jgi:hypothetical protein
MLKLEKQKKKKQGKGNKLLDWHSQIVDKNYCRWERVWIIIIPESLFITVLYTELV